MVDVLQAPDGAPAGSITFGIARVAVFGAAMARHVVASARNLLGHAPALGALFPARLLCQLGQLGLGARAAVLGRLAFYARAPAAFWAGAHLGLDAGVGDAGGTLLEMAVEAAAAGALRDACVVDGERLCGRHRLDRGAWDHLLAAGRREHLRLAHDGRLQQVHQARLAVRVVAGHAVHGAVDGLHAGHTLVFGAAGTGPGTVGMRVPVALGSVGSALAFFAFSGVGLGFAVGAALAEIFEL